MAAHRTGVPALPTDRRAALAQISAFALPVISLPAAPLPVVSLSALPAGAATSAAPPERVLADWFRLILELVRHTPTCSPPVASRALAYAGIIAFESVAGGDPALRSLAGQVNGLAPLPPREPGAHDPAAVLHAALSSAARGLFHNTGPTGQQAMAAMDRILGAAVDGGLPADVAARSRAAGRAVAAHVLGWAASDGGAVIENLGFPLAHDGPAGPDKWVPTSRIALQQAPLLPGWGSNRPFALPDGTACALPPPPAYSEEAGSAFHAEAAEVHRTCRSLTGEQEAIARFWSDDAMLSPTPPGHWFAIAAQVLDRTGADLARRAETLALLGIAQADAFIACWQAKYTYNLLRPVTYIRRVIDPAFQPLLTTPPFPEYPSGHSTQSAAAAEVLTQMLGDTLSFTDATHEGDGLPPRSFASFRAAADEAGISRLYGGIHFRAAVEQGAAQGRCTAAQALRLRTRA
jgi:hypothetical protein